MCTLLKEFGPLEGPLLKQCTEGVLEGMNYLHSRSPPVVHRDLHESLSSLQKRGDIKGANILVDLNFNAPGLPKFTGWLR